MATGFEFETEAEEVLEEYDQNEIFTQIFIKFCKNAMQEKSEESDLERLIENVKLSEEEGIDES
jgi:hypothetical protein